MAVGALCLDQPSSNRPCTTCNKLRTGQVADDHTGGRAIIGAAGLLGGVRGHTELHSSLSQSTARRYLPRRCPTLRERHAFEEWGGEASAVARGVGQEEGAGIRHAKCGPVSTPVSGTPSATGRPARSQWIPFTKLASYTPAKSKWVQAQAPSAPASPGFTSAGHAPGSALESARQEQGRGPRCSCAGVGQTGGQV